MSKTRFNYDNIGPNGAGGRLRWEREIVRCGTMSRYVNRLTPSEEDRVLTRDMLPGYLWYRDDPSKDGCLIGTALGARELPLAERYTIGQRAALHIHAGVGNTYAVACARFGVLRVNAAIRNRILRNQAQRALTAPSMAHTPRPEAQEITV